MSVDDYEFATELANSMNWNMAPEDFEFNRSLEPDGCLVALDNSKRIGIATCISFGQVGWFGNLIVEKEYRKHGVGGLLVKHAVNYLQNKGVKTIGLYAYPNLLNFYGSLGFKHEQDFSLLSTEALGTVQGEASSETGRPHILAIERFDLGYFGGERRRLLESIILEKGNLSYCAFDGKELVGYVAATVYEKMAWVGPLICQENKTDVAASLIREVLMKLSGLSVYMVLPKKEKTLHEMLFDTGFSEEFGVSRMFLGEAVAKNCIYLAESLERG